MKHLIFYFLGFVLLTGFSTDRGEPSVSISVDKMNVLYVGVNNPISISSKNISTAELKIVGIGCLITRISATKYIIKVSRPGTTSKVVVKYGEKTLKEIEFRAKRIPNPVPMLAIRKTLSNQYSAEEFKEIVGLAMMLENFDFEARCNTQSYYLTRVTKDGVRKTVANTGASLRGESKNLVEGATSGDIYIFDRIKSRCPGDMAGRSYQTGIVAYIK